MNVSLLAGKLMIGMVKAYQNMISPYLMPACRYTPTCSQYAVEAIGKFGPAKGGYLAVKRLCSCHPWGGHGYDPVPGEEVRSEK